MQRRGVLKLGAAGVAALALAGGAAVLFRQPSWTGRHFDPAARGVLASISAALLDGSLPDDPQARERAVPSHIDRLEMLVAGLPQATRRELDQVMSVLSTSLGRSLLTGLSTEWSRATPAEVQSALDTMRSSRLAMRRQVYHALRDLVRAAWFSDPATWPAVGYPGPRPV